MAPDLDRMRAERERLDREIRQAEAEAANAFNFTLDRLSDAAYEHARKNGIPWADDSRKNWVTLVLDGRLTVEFGQRDDEDRTGGLMVIAGGMTAEFDPLPAPEALTALLAFLLAQEGR